MHSTFQRVMNQYYPSLKLTKERESEIVNLMIENQSTCPNWEIALGGWRDMFCYWFTEEERSRAFLHRFILAQEVDYEKALEEVKSGKKTSHWIWYIFPQMRGLGHSANSQYYGIISREEAKAYINNETLRNRLVEISEAVLNNKYSVYEIFGDDAIKVRSCMKLFASVCDIPVFNQILTKYHWL